ncbi:MAG TPA: hypothetical protein VH835_05600 [Dongiaceae bacterium]
MESGQQGAFQVRLLGAGQVRLALPLARLLYPSLTEPQWAAYAAGPGGEAAPKRRVLVACNPAGYLHGLCTLCGGIDLRHGRALDVEDVVVVSFLDAGSVTRALLDGIEDLARRDGFSEIRVHLPDGDLPHRQAVADTLGSGGHVRIAACYAKLLPPRPAAP